MTINEHLSSQPHIGGGASPLNQQQNLERRNRGLSLLNQTEAHCISPSSCDNTTSLNDINLQLHASSTVSNPYSFNITKDVGFNATCMAENTVTVTVGEATKVQAETKYYYYGYNNNVNSGPVFGQCSPSTYHGIKISNIYTQTVVNDTLQGPNVSAQILFIGFTEHVDINRIIINESTYTIGEYHGDDDSFGCQYVLDIQDDNPEVQDYFTDNVGKQITITLEFE